MEIPLDEIISPHILLLGSHLSLIMHYLRLLNFLQQTL